MVEVRSFCRICIANCGIVVTVDDTIEPPAVVHVRGDADHPVSKGYTCPKGRALPALHHDPRRLEHPQLKDADTGALSRVSWDELLDDLAARVSSVLGESGPDSVGMYFATGAALDAAGRRGADRFYREIGTKQKYTSLTIDSPSKPLIAELVGGWAWLNPIIHEDECRLLLLLGINPVVSHGHTSAMSNPRARLRAQRERGELWVVDPRRSESAEMATRHLQNRQGSDAFVLGFLVKEMLADGADREFLAAHATDVDALTNAVAVFDLGTCAARAGLDPQDLLDLLAAVRRAGRIAVLAGTGVTMSAGANVAEWMRWALLVVTGSVDRPGGMWFNPGFLSQFDHLNLPVAPPEGIVETGPAVRARPEIRKRFGEIPSSALVSEIEAGNIRALFVLGGNVVHTFPDTERTRAALASLDVLVVSDIIDTATTRLATHVLPTVGQLERADLPLLLDAFQDSVMSQRTAAVVPPVAERRPLWWSLAKLGERMGLAVLPAGTTADTTTDDDILAPVIARSRNPEALATAPAVVLAEAAVFGWVTERILPDGRWRLAPSALVALLPDFMRAPVHPLVLTPRRLLRAMNSQFRDAATHGGKPPMADILINPVDAAASGVRDGELVHVTGGPGSTSGRARVTNDIVAGAVSMTHGWDSPDVNRLTTAHEAVDALSGMVLYAGIPVTLEPLNV